MHFEEYAALYGCDVIHWAHLKTRVSMTLKEALLHLAEFDVQILYANDAVVTQSDTFSALCALIKRGAVWALNVGEAWFSEKQCEELYQCVADSNVAFMFVDSIMVGATVVRRLKKLIQERRRNSSSRWLLGPDMKQNNIIMRCTNMWFAPWSLGRNRTFLETQHQFSSRV